ncbi:MAG TPA: FAD-binding oxidoreductase [Bryobacteraceae bacterium]|nr:FAD-binding oxidoreductase [Bryobacteraceae bacterium]
MGCHEGEDPRRPEALHREGNVAASADHAGDSGGIVPPQYLEDASGFRGHSERVILPSDEAGVIAALREASAAAIAVTISGAGTGLTGARVPFGGWVLSLERLNHLEVHTGYAIAGPGVLLRELHAAAQGTGQFYPPDPTETSASIGGTIATNASGSRSFRYGATRRWVERLRVVLPDGRNTQVARGEAIDFDPGTIPLPDVTKNTAGYLLRPGMDWIDLFVGSEGTLGVVTEARLRLLPIPPAVLGGVIFFPSDEAAVDAVESWRNTASPRMLEYFDAPSLALLGRRFPEIPLAARAAILFEQELQADDDPEVDAWVSRIEDSAALAGDSWVALTPRDRERFRHFRHSLPELVNDTVRQSGAMKMNSDYAVPLGRNREMLAFYRQRLEAEFPGLYVIFGHIGDAHVHVNIFSDPANPGHASGLLLEFARHAVSLGGTVSAEHGLGKRKAHLLKLQYAPEHLMAMQTVKRRFDPQGILGRGTLAL